MMSAKAPQWPASGLAFTTALVSDAVACAENTVSGSESRGVTIREATNGQTTRVRWHTDGRYKLATQKLTLHERIIACSIWHGVQLERSVTDRILFERGHFGSQGCRRRSQVSGVIKPGMF